MPELEEPVGVAEVAVLRRTPRGWGGRVYPLGAGTRAAMETALPAFESGRPIVASTSPANPARHGDGIAAEAAIE
eukprot:11127760-Prorocentrum_lima.AAC.1